jgi:hypothetical protein
MRYYYNTFTIGNYNRPYILLNNGKLTLFNIPINMTLIKSPTLQPFFDALSGYKHITDITIWESLLKTHCSQQELDNLIIEMQKHYP